MSFAKTGFSLLQCTRLACHMQMLRRRSDGRESNCVKILEGQDFLFVRVEVSRVGGWCSMRKGRRPGSWIFFSTDVVDPCSYEFLILASRGHDAAKISC